MAVLHGRKWQAWYHVVLVASCLSFNQAIIQPVSDTGYKWFDSLLIWHFSSFKFIMVVNTWKEIRKEIKGHGCLVYILMPILYLCRDESRNQVCTTEWMAFNCKLWSHSFSRNSVGDISAFYPVTDTKFCQALIRFILLWDMDTWHQTHFAGSKFSETNSDIDTRTSSSTFGSSTVEYTWKMGIHLSRKPCQFW